MTERYRLTGGQYVPMYPDDGSGPPPLADVTPYVRPADLAAYARLVDLGSYVTADQLSQYATDADLAGYLPLSQLESQVQAGAVQAFTGLAANLVPRHNPKLRRWYADLAGREVTPAQILVMGDSIHEGYGVALLRRIVNLLQRELCARTGSPNGAATPYIPGVYNTGQPAPFTTAGTVTPLPDFGLGLRVMRLDTGGTWTLTQQATQFRVVYTRGTGAGIMRVAIDGGTATLVDTYDGGSTTSVGTWLSPILTAGSHTIVISRDTTTATGRNIYLEGVAVYNGDAASGIRVVDGSRSGWSANQFAARGDWARSAAALGPFGLAILPLGTNDLGNLNRSPQQFGADLAAVIANLRTVGGHTGSILLPLLYMGRGRDATVWDAYGAQMRIIADGDPDIVYIDLRPFIPPVPTPATAPAGLGLYQDDLHPSETGDGYLADLYADLLMPRAAA